MSLLALEPGDAPVRIRRHDPVVAILVDAENFPAALLARAMEFAGRIGQVNIRRAFANFEGGSGVSSWRNGPCAKLAITPVHVPTTTQGKNASDIALAMHAMDIAHLKQAEVVCVASSDGDFAMLGHRLREFGITVVGFGSDRAPLAWTAACDRFEALYSIPASGSRSAAKPPAKAAPVPPKPAPWGKDDVAPVAAVVDEYMGALPERTFSSLGLLVAAAIPGFDPRHYGFSKLRLLVQSMPGFEVVPGPTGDPTAPSIRRVGPSPSTPAPETIPETPEQASRSRAVAAALAVISEAPDLSPQSFWARVRRDAGVTLGDLGLASIREFVDLALATKDANEQASPPRAETPAEPTGPDVPSPYQGAGVRDRVASAGRTPRASVGGPVELTPDRIASGIWGSDDTTTVLAVVERLLSETEPCLLNDVGTALRGEIHHFDPRRHGYCKLKDLVGSLPGIEVGMGPKGARNVFVVRREEDAPPTPTAAASVAWELGEGDDPDAPIRATMRRDAVAAIAKLRAADPGIPDSALWATVRQAEGITLRDIGATSIKELLASIDGEAADSSDSRPLPASTASEEPAAADDARTTYEIIRSVLNRSTVDAITKAVDAFVGDEPLAELSGVGHALRAAVPGFDSNILGHAGMRELIHSLDGFEVVPVKGMPGLRIRRTEKVEPAVAEAPPTLREIAYTKAREVAAAEPGIDPKRLWLKVRGLAPGVTLADTGFESVRDFLDADEGLKRVGRT